MRVERDGRVARRRGACELSTRRDLIGLGLVAGVGLVISSRRPVVAQTAVADPEPDPEPEEGEASATMTIGTPAAGQGILTIYSGQHPEFTKTIAAAFADATGIATQIRSAEDPELANQIIAEGASSPADVFIAANSPALMRLSEQGLLTPVPAEILSQVPARYNAPAGDWVGVAARATVLVYAPSLLPETALPASLLDLAKPEWQGKVGIAPAESDFLPVVTAVIRLEGEDVAREWAEGLAHNATVYLGNTPILRAVEAGQLATGVINHYYWFRLAAEVGTSAMRSNLYYFGHLDPGALVNVSGAGILASSSQPELARQFLAFLVSEPGQEALVQTNTFEYPLRGDVAPAPGLKPLAELDPPDLGPGDLGDNQQAVELLLDVGLL
jgi:iron(III) transport system substrate-binding protein